MTNLDRIKRMDADKMATFLDMASEGDIDWDAFNSKLEIQYAEGRGKTLAPTILEEEP